MSTALLILGYHAPECLRAALPIYQAAGMQVYVHVDRKADLDAYKARLGEDADACIFVSPRQSIFWAGFNMVQAEMVLLDHALKSMSGHSRFALISDDTFPLMRPDRLQSFLSEDLDRIDFRKLDEDDQFTPRYRRFFFFDHQATSLHGRAVESAFFDDDLRRAFADMERLREVGKKPVDLYYGSQWWALTRRTAAEVLRSYQEDFHLTSSFRFSAVPDEMFVQTLIGNRLGFERARRSCTLVDWSRMPRPYVFGDIEDIRAHTTTDHAFIRKVSSQDPDFLPRLAGAVRDGLLEH